MPGLGKSSSTGVELLNAAVLPAQVPAGSALRAHLRALVDLAEGTPVTRSWVDAEATYSDRKAVRLGKRE